MTWETELAKAENDTLRTSGDVKGILDKYKQPSGSTTWNDTTLGTVTEHTATSLKLWTTVDWTTLKDVHTEVDGTIRTSVKLTRDFIKDRVSIDEWRNLKGVISVDETLAGSLNLKLDREKIEHALRKTSDSPQYKEKNKSTLVKQIRLKVRNGDLNKTSEANLTTINSIIGV